MQFMQTREYAVGKRYADSSLLILGQGMNRFCALWNEQYTQNKIPTKFLTLVKESIAADKRNSRFANKCRDKSLSQMAAEGKYLDDTNWLGCIELYVRRLQEWGRELRYDVPKTPDGAGDYAKSQCYRSPFDLSPGKMQSAGPSFFACPPPHSLFRASSSSSNPSSQHKPETRFPSFEGASSGTSRCTTTSPFFTMEVVPSRFLLPR